MSSEARPVRVSAPAIAIARQFLRFAVAGAVVTGIAAGGYWILASSFMPPLAANICGWTAATATGFFLHRRWSFQSTSRRPNESFRFFTVAVLALAINTFFVWLITGLFDGPIWLSVAPLVFITPLATFSLNRTWVFRL